MLPNNPPKTCRAKLQLIIICPGLGLVGSTGWFPFEAPHTIAASPRLKLSSHKDSSLSCLMPGLGWQPQLEAGWPLCLSPRTLHIRSLGFLASWRSRSSWASPLAVVFSQNECSKGLRHKPPGIASLYSISQVPVRSESRGRGTDLLSLWGDSICQQGKETNQHLAPGGLLHVRAHKPASGHSPRALCSACSRQNSWMR